MKKLAVIAAIMGALSFSSAANAGGLKFCDYYSWHKSCQKVEVFNFKDLLKQPEVSFASILKSRSWKEIIREVSKLTKSKNFWHNKNVYKHAWHYCSKRKNRNSSVCSDRPTDPVVTVPEPSTLGLLGLGLLAVGVARRRARLAVK